MPAPTVREGSLEFQFPEGWSASKFDEWSFYRGQFARVGDARMNCNRKGCGRAVQCVACGAKRVAGNRGIDILAIDPESSTCRLIEVKDYRSTRTSDFEFLADVVALKVRDTLACLAAARWNAPVEQERDQARSALTCESLRIVLHLEVPRARGSLDAPSTPRANVSARMKQLVKAIDARPLVVSLSDPDGLPWRVTGHDARS